MPSAIRMLQHRATRAVRVALSFSSFSFSSWTCTQDISVTQPNFKQHKHIPFYEIYLRPAPTHLIRFFSSTPSQKIKHRPGPTDDEQGDAKEEGVEEGWEEEENQDIEPQIGDGGDGGGIVFRDDAPWGQQTLSFAQEVLSVFSADEDITIFSFKTSPRGYIYIRLDKHSDKYGCPGMEEIENFSRLYKSRLDEAGAHGEIPSDLALEVSSPGAERLLKVPNDLLRFKEMPMKVSYVEGDSPEMDGIFLFDSIETESEHCVWKLANVKENRDVNGQSKGKPFSRKQKDWRLRLPFQMMRRVTLYLEF